MAGKMPLLRKQFGGLFAPFIKIFTCPTQLNEHCKQSSLSRA